MLTYILSKTFTNVDVMGFKIGWLTWEQRKLEKVFDTITDYVANGSFESLRKNVNSSDINGFAYLVRLQDASNNWQGPWLYTDQHGYEFLKKSRLQPDDIIMANVGSVGKFFLVPKLDKPMTLAPNAVLIKSSENDQRFLYQMMLTPEMQYKIFEKTTPGVQSKINKTDFKMIETRLPNMDEQKKMGAFFKQLDDTIALQQRKLDQLNTLKKGLLQKMFADKKHPKPELRFKGFSGDWEQHKLGNISNRLDNLRVPVTASKREKGNTPYYGANGIQDYVSGFTHDGQFVLIAEDGANDVNNYPIRFVTGKIWVNNHAHVLQGKIGSVDNKFLTNAIKKVNISTFLVGGSRAKLNADVLMKIKISIPTMTEQIKIGTMLSKIDNLIALQQSKLDKLNSLKKSLLQNMFI